MKHLFSNQKAFTLVEILVVLTIIGIVTTLATFALNGARIKARDAKRVAYVDQINTALGLYYMKYKSYPTMITPGQAFMVEGTKYLDPVPSNPTPRTDGICGNSEYTYAVKSDNSDYTLNFCLGAATGKAKTGVNSVSSGGYNSAPGLVGWWQMDEGSGTTAADTTIFKNDCTFVGSPTWLTSSSCKKGNCLSFNGSTYLTCGSNSSLNYVSGLTMMAWVKHTTLGTGPYVVLAKNNNRYVLETYAAGYIYGTITSGVDSWLGTNSAVIPNTGWHHVALTHNAADNIVSIYLDGVSVKSASVAWSTDNVGVVNIGSRVGSFNWDGALDDVRIYNRALTASEILAVYNVTQ